MRKIIQEIISYVGGVANIDSARITGDDRIVTIDTIDEAQTVIIKGRLKSVADEFKGEIGLGKFARLKGLINFANFKTEDADIKLVYRKRNDVEVPEDLVFSNETTGNYASHRLVHPDTLPPKARFKGANWDVVVSPTSNKVQEFQTLANISSSDVDYFNVKTENGNLVFYLGDVNQGGDTVSMIFSNDVSGNMSHGWSWPLMQVLQIIKLAPDISKLKLNFSDQGALQIDVETALADWSYILPAKLK